MPVSSAFIPALLLMMGLMIFVRALRGRRIDDHPICRRCGFDLIGLPTDSKNCSECGADLTRRRAIRIGHRDRRPRIAIFGLLLMTPAFIIGGVLGLNALKQVNWIEKEPCWFVARQSRSTDPLDRDLALDELTRRILLSQLSPAQVKPLTDAALAAQADLNVEWSSRWGDLILAAWTTGKLSADDWKRYLANAVQVTLVAGPQIRRGEPLPIRIDRDDRRASGSFIYAIGEIAVERGSDLLTPGTIDEPIEALNGGASLMRELHVDPAQVSTAPYGPKTLHLVIKLNMSPMPIREGELGLASKTVHVQATWNLVSTPTSNPAGSL